MARKDKQDNIDINLAFVNWGFKKFEKWHKAWGKDHLSSPERFKKMGGKIPQ